MHFICDCCFIVIICPEQNRNLINKINIIKFADISSLGYLFTERITVSLCGIAGNTVLKKTEFSPHLGTVKEIVVHFETSSLGYSVWLQFPFVFHEFAVVSSDQMCTISSGISKNFSLVGLRDF